MSSNIPTRRTTRVTRLPDENAVKGRTTIARAGAKPGTTAAAAGPSKPSAASAALDANAQNKRKREALGEVTNNKNKNVPRGITKDGKIAKPHVLITTKPVRPMVKAPIRKTRAAPSKEVEVQEEEAQEKDDDAMAVDEPVPAKTLHRVTRRLSTRTTTTVTTTATTAATTRRVTQHKRSAAAIVAAPSHAETVEVEEDQLDDADNRAFKKRRTSSEADVEAVVETEVEAEAPLADEGPEPQADLDADIIESAPKVDDDEEEDATGWEDLDAEDFDDPYMVSEYVVDIFKYLSECEGQTLPNPKYMVHQNELDWPQRGVLMDYLIGIHHRFRMNPETLYLAVNIIDRFLSMRVVSISKFQLVGLSSLLIASKFEEILAPSVENLIRTGAMPEETEEKDMLKAERYILKTLNWSIGLFPQPMNWLRRISKADDYDPQVRALAKYFLEIHVVEKRLIGVKPSLIAAASIWLGRLVMGHFGWTPNLAHYSGYGEKKILPVANVMLNYCLRPQLHENFNQKYASKKYSKVGVYIHDWVAARWATGVTGSKISLIDELPRLRQIAEEKGE